MKIEMWPIDRPIDYPANARKWSAKAVEKVAASIKEFGFRQPLVCDKNDVIVIGHLRRTSARSLKMKQVPVHVARDLSDEQIRALRLADNRTNQESEWDFTLLAPELAQLKALNFDLSITAFDSRELDGLLRVDDGRADDAPPLPGVPASRTGDLWLMGEHRLLCGDATSAEDVARVCGSSKSSAIWTDPPYGVKYVGKTRDALTITGDTPEGVEALVLDALTSAAPCCIPSAPFYIAHPPGALFLAFGRGVQRAGWRIHQNLVWVKDSMVLGHSDYHFNHEPILYGFAPGEGRPGRGKHA